MVSTRLQSSATSEDVASKSNSTSTLCAVWHETPASTVNSNTPSSTQHEHYSSKTHLLDLPSECIEKIFSYLGYNKVSQLRLVSRTLDQVCSEILNSTFQKLQNQMHIRFQKIKTLMPRRESARRNHPMSYECDIVETVHMRLTLLQMSFGKHIERKHICFFPGEILDEVYRILNYLKITPKLGRPFKVTDELFDLSTMAMEYFKERIEPSLPEIAYFCPDFLALGSNGKQLALDSPTHKGDEFSDECVSLHPRRSVLAKRVQRMGQGLKRYKLQIGHVRKELRCSRNKIAECYKQMSEYASRLDEYEKKCEETNQKFGAMLQELNKCKTVPWLSKSPQTTFASVAEVSKVEVQVVPVVVEVKPEPYASTSKQNKASTELRSKRRSTTTAANTEAPLNKKQRNGLKSRSKNL